MKIIAYSGNSLCQYHWNDGYRPTNTRQPMEIHGGFPWKWWMCMTFLHVNDFAEKPNSYGVIKVVGGQHRGRK